MPKLNKELLRKLSGIEWPHWTTVTMWTIGIVVMSGLTVKNLVPILENYFDDEENVQVKIKVGDSKDIVIGPDIYLLIPLEPSDEAYDNFSRDLQRHLKYSEKCSRCDQMANHSFYVWKNIPLNSTVLATDNAIWSETINDDNSSIAMRWFIERYLEQTLLELNPNFTHRSVINRDNAEWNQPIIYAIASLLAQETKDERKLLQGGYFGRVTPDGIWEEGHLDRRRIYQDYMNALHSVVTSFVCEFISFGDRDETTTDVCSELFNDTSLVIEYKNHYYLSIRLPQDADRIKTKISYISIAHDYFDRYLNERKPIAIAAVDPIKDESPVVNYETSPKDLRVAKHILEDIYVTYSLQSTVNETRRHKLKTCYKESSKVECEWNCRLDMFEKSCGCPSYFRRRFPSHDIVSGDDNLGKAYCNQTDFTSCAETLKNKTERRCSEKCRDPCVMNSYYWRVSSNLDGASSLENEGRAALYLNVQADRQQESHLEFIMRVKDTEEDLVAAVGGSFNFYLGLSGLSIIFFLIYLIDSGRRIRRLQREATAEDVNAAAPTGSDDSATWRWRWMQLATLSVNHRSVKETDASAEISTLRRRLDESEAIREKDIDRTNGMVMLIDELRVQNRLLTEKSNSLSQKIDVLTEALFAAKIVGGKQE